MTMNIVPRTVELLFSVYADHKIIFDYKLFLKQCRNDAEVSKEVSARKFCEKKTKEHFALALFQFVTPH
jgi:hypothetical protein